MGATCEIHHLNRLIQDRCEVRNLPNQFINVISALSSESALLKGGFGGFGDVVEWWCDAETAMSM